jgi:hypothetical protein
MSSAAIAIEQRLVERREHVEVDFAGLVVVGEALLHRVARDLDRDTTALPHVIRGRLEHRQRSARIAVGLASDDLVRVVIDFEA